MLPTIAERLREERKKRVRVDPFDFYLIFDMPSALDTAVMGSVEFDDIKRAIEHIQEYVIDWDDVFETTILMNGSGDKVDFDPDTLRLWLENDKDLWQPLEQWLAAEVRNKNLGFSPGSDPDERHVIALEIWVLMGKRMDWHALPVIVEYYGVQKITPLIDDLLTMQELLGHGG